MSRYHVINGSLMPIAGLQVADEALSTTSERPVQNKAVATALEEVKVYKTTVQIISLPYTLVNNNITEEMEATGTVLSNPAAQLSTWTWTIPDGGGSIVIDGTIATNQTTDLTLYIEKVRNL